MKPHIWYRAGFWHCGHPGANPIGVSRTNAHLAYWSWFREKANVRIGDWE